MSVRKVPFPSHLRIAAFADLIKFGKNKTYDIDNKYYRLGETVANILSTALGFNYTLLPSVDGEFGRQLANGSWTGMVGMVNRSEADLAISGIAITEKRSTAVTYSYPTTVIDVTFVTQAPEKSSDLYNTLKPLAFDVWIGFFIYHILMPFMFYAVLRKSYSFQNVVLTTCGTFLGQPTFKKVEKLPQKIMVLTWMCGMMFLSLIYKANLLSTLTFPTLKGVRTIRELATEVEKGRYMCVSYAGSFYGHELLKATDVSFEIIGKDLEKNPGSSNPEEVMKIYRKSAFIGPKPDLMHLKYKYFVSKSVFFLEFPGIVMRHDFCCKEKVNEVVFKMHAAGLYRKALEKESFQLILQNFAELAYSREEAIAPLTLKDFHGAFLFAGAGYVLAIVTFVVELIRGRKDSKRKKRKSSRKSKLEYKNKSILQTETALRYR